MRFKCGDYTVGMQIHIDIAEPDCVHWLPRREPEGDLTVHALPAFEEFICSPAETTEIKEVMNV